MRRSRRYSRKNQLDDTTLIVGGLVAVAVVGGLIYWVTRPATPAVAAASQIQGGLTAQQLGIPAGMSPQQAAAYLSGTAGVSYVDSSGNPVDSNGNPLSSSPALPVTTSGS